MSELEIVGTNIVALLVEQPTRLSEIAAVVEEDAVSRVLRKPIGSSQTVTLVGAKPSVAFQLESMRSQKAVVVDAGRLEVHDRSGRLQSDPGIADVFCTLASAFGVERTTKLGFNTELTFREPKGRQAAAAIAEEVLNPRVAQLHEGFSVVGGSSRLFLRGPDGTDYTLAVEPRGNEPEAALVWALCSAQITLDRIPPISELARMLEASQAVLRRTVDGLFPGLQGWD